MYIIHIYAFGVTLYAPISTYVPIACRGDYNSLTSDIFRSFWLNVRPLKHHHFNGMYGCLTNLSDIMAIDGFWPIISANS